MPPCRLARGAATAALPTERRLKLAPATRVRYACGLASSRQLAFAFVALASACAHERPPVAGVPPAVVESAPSPTVEPPAPVSTDVVRIARPAGESSPIFSVQVDAERVYFNDGAGQLWAAPKDGSAPASMLVDGGRDHVRSFVVDGEALHYATAEQLRTVPVRGGESSLGIDSPSGPVLLVGDAKALYHTTFDGSATLRWVVGAAREERFCAGGKHQTLAVDDSNVYVASYARGTITAISRKTRRARLLVEGVRRPVRVAVHAGWVYFTSEADGAIRRVRARGGRVDVLARHQSDPEHLAIDDAHVYWASKLGPGHYALMRAPVAGKGEPEAIYSGLHSAAGLSVDDDFVYVADRGAGEVVRVRKPAL